MIPNSKELNSGLLAWIDRLSSKWDLLRDETALRLGETEIENRLDFYPAVAEAVCTHPISLPAFADAVRKCWAVGDRYTQVRMNALLKHPDGLPAIQRLVSAFPDSDSAASARIESFVEDAVESGFKTPTGGNDRSGAALLASVILTSILPDRFVDYRKSRWQRFAEQIGYTDLPPLKDYGELLLWTGKFAAALAGTKTFQTYWSEGESLWVLSGLSWQDPSEPPTNTTLDPQSVPEGGQKQRLHLVRERNQTIVRAAKKIALQRDGALNCAACHFCFTEVYGPLGTGFIEAHHSKPVSTLKQGSRTSVNDIVLLCANCHRMIHRGPKTMSLNELRSLLDGNLKR
jgi:HNH endonuclease